MSLLEKTSISITRLKRSPRTSAIRRILNTWKDKYLDYEIETVNLDPAQNHRTLRLKRQVSRLRDWNMPPRMYINCNIILEKTSISITRLKLMTLFRTYWQLSVTWKDKYLDYEIETPSSRAISHLQEHAWKDKYLDYEIETVMNAIRMHGWRTHWKDKYLDYEIETPASHLHRGIGTALKRQVSRLRDWNYDVSSEEVAEHPTWKDKYLDYEIETTMTNRRTLSVSVLKRQVSRLRDWNEVVYGHWAAPLYLKRQVSRLRDWNKTRSNWVKATRKAWKDKYLDYEIETRRLGHRVGERERTWKDKYLDYEIETSRLCASWRESSFLKRQVSRLRDWNLKSSGGSSRSAVRLKRQVSRLRDWNNHSQVF